MKTIILLTTLILLQLNNLFCQMQNFVFINWSQETITATDFELRFQNQGAEQEWGEELREYSAKEIKISKIVESIKIKTISGVESELKISEPSLEYISKKGKHLKASIISTTGLNAMSSEIIGVNICDNEESNQEMTKQFVVINLSNYDIPKIWILYGDGTEPTQYNKIILAHSIVTISINSLDLDNDGLFNGKEVFNYYYPCDLNCNTSSWELNYSCSNTIQQQMKDRRQQMLVGVEISNSVKPANRLIVHKPK